MPIANLVNMIGLAGTGIEPIKKNQYRLRLQVTNLIGVLENYFSDDRDYLETIKSALTNDTYPIEVSFTPPAIQVEARTTRGAGNVQVKYAGYVSYGNAEATFNNFVELDTYKFFYRWASLSGALALVCQNDQILGQTPSNPLPVPDFAGDSTSGAYKVNGTVSSYHTVSTAYGDETENTHWVLQGVFPTAVSAGDLNHTDDGEMLLTNVSFSVDLALPMTGQTVTF